MNADETRYSTFTASRSTRFEPDAVCGYRVSDEPLRVLDRVLLTRLFERRGDGGTELRITPSLWPFGWCEVHSSVEFSGLRLRNAARYPNQF